MYIHYRCVYVCVGKYIFAYVYEHIHSVCMRLVLDAGVFYYSFERFGWPNGTLEGKPKL